MGTSFSAGKKMTPVPTSKISNNIRLSERVDKIQTIAPGFLPCGIKTFRYGIPGFLCGKTIL
jgi:hypothetical protein